MRKMNPAETFFWAFCLFLLAVIGFTILTAVVVR